MAVAEPKALESSGAKYEGRFTQKEAAEAAGINTNTLARWLAGELFEPPRTKLSETRWLWTQEDVERLKEYALRMRESRRAKPRLPKQRGKMGRPSKVLDASRIDSLRLQGKSWREIGRILGVHPLTASKAAASVLREEDHDER
jgi:hypothetical protein